jgi:hypothetical protein
MRPRRRQHARQIGAGEELHRQVRAAVGDGAPRDQLDHVRMRDPHHHLGLTQEARHRGRRAAQLAVQHLDRDDAAGGRVVRAVH